MSFVHPTAPPRTLGPVKSICVEGECLRDGVDGAVLARHIRHQWEVDGQLYYRLDCTTRVTVCFQGGGRASSRVFGPFNRFSAVDGLAYTDDAAFAYLDPKNGAWLCYDEGKHWPQMIVSKA